MIGEVIKNRIRELHTRIHLSSVTSDNYLLNAPSWRTLRYLRVEAGRVSQIDLPIVSPRDRRRRLISKIECITLPLWFAKVILFMERLLPFCAPDTLQLIKLLLRISPRFCIVDELVHQCSFPVCTWKIVGACGTERRGSREDRPNLTEKEVSRASERTDERFDHLPQSVLAGL